MGRTLVTCRYTGVRYCTLYMETKARRLRHHINPDKAVILFLLLTVSQLIDRRRHVTYVVRCRCVNGALLVN